MKTLIAIATLALMANQARAEVNPALLTANPWCTETSNEQGERIVGKEVYGTDGRVTMTEHKLVEEDHYDSDPMEGSSTTGRYALNGSSLKITFADGSVSNYQVSGNSESLSFQDLDSGEVESYEACE